MKNIEDMTLEEYQKYWYDRYFELFGKGAADKWLKDNLNHHTALKALWIAKGFRTVGEFESWEKGHAEERDEFLGRYKK
jgi:hypothetical protein